MIAIFRTAVNQGHSRAVPFLAGQSDTPSTSRRGLAYTVSEPVLSFGARTSQGAAASGSSGVFKSEHDVLREIEQLRAQQRARELQPFAGGDMRANAGTMMSGTPPTGHAQNMMDTGDDGFDVFDWAPAAKAATPQASPAKARKRGREDDEAATEEDSSMAVDMDDDLGGDTELEDEGDDSFVATMPPPPRPRPSRRLPSSSAGAGRRRGLQKTHSLPAHVFSTDSGF